MHDVLIDEEESLRLEKKEEELKQLSESIKAKIQAASDRCSVLSQEHGCDVKFEYLIERVDSEPTGEIIVAYFKQPNMFLAVKAMDLIAKRDMYAAGFLLWPGMFIPAPTSSSKIEAVQKIKIGLLPFVASLVEVLFPELKKN